MLVFESRHRKEFERQLLPEMPAAYRLACAIVRNADDAADVVQEAYLLAWAAFAQCRGEGAGAKPWLLAIVRNAALRLLRTRSRQANVIPFEPSLHAAQAVAGEASPELLAMQQGELLQVQRALDALPIPYREVLLLREVEALTYQQIATVVGVPVGTVMSRLHRARAQPRAALGAPAIRESGE